MIQGYIHLFILLQKSFYFESNLIFSKSRFIADNRAIRLTKFCLSEYIFPMESDITTIIQPFNGFSCVQINV